ECSPFPPLLSETPRVCNRHSPHCAGGAERRCSMNDPVDQLLKMCRIPDGQQSRSSASSAFSAQGEEPWQEPVPLSETPEAAAFPITVLPGYCLRYVEEVAWALNCPIDFVAVPLLAIAGGAIGNSRRLAITQPHHQSACLFAVIVGDPGSSKSP